MTVLTGTYGSVHVIRSGNVVTLIADLYASSPLAANTVLVEGVPKPATSSTYRRSGLLVGSNGMCEICVDGTDLKTVLALANSGYYRTILTYICE